MADRSESYSPSASRSTSQCSGSSTHSSIPELEAAALAWGASDNAHAALDRFQQEVNRLKHRLAEELANLRTLKNQKFVADF